MFDGREGATKIGKRFSPLGKSKDSSNVSASFQSQPDSFG